MTLTFDFLNVKARSKFVGLSVDYICTKFEHLSHPFLSLFDFVPALYEVW